MPATKIAKVMIKERRRIRANGWLTGPCEEGPFAGIVTEAELDDSTQNSIVKHIFKHDGFKGSVDIKNSHEVRFTFRGHAAITAMHPTTLEITKDKELTKQGDCIIGVGADFDSTELTRICKEGGTLKLTITAGRTTETVTGTANPDYASDKEIVVRMGEFKSARTLMIEADKGAKQISRELVAVLRRPETVGRVIITAE